MFSLLLNSSLERSIFTSASPAAVQIKGDKEIEQREEINKLNLNLEKQENFNSILLRMPRSFYLHVKSF
jgi:hypothetical protein